MAGVVHGPGEGEGDVAVLGEDPWRDVATLHRRLAYVPGEVNLWPNLTGGEVSICSEGCAAASIRFGAPTCWNGFSSTLQLPTWAQDISPFTHTPKLPAAQLTALPVLSLIAISAALVAAGLASLRHRNLALPT